MWFALKILVIAIHIIGPLIAIAKIGDGSRGNWDKNWALASVIINSLLVLYYSYALRG
jgi:hypothetical protein